MFVLCVFYSKRIKGKARRIRTKKHREQKKIPPGAWMFVVCVVGTDTTQNAR
jgi:hypothetical protein